MKQSYLSPSTSPVISGLSTLAACLILAALPAQATISSTGLVVLSPTPSPIGPLDLVQPAATLWVGNGGAGTLSVDGASFMQLARLNFGAGLGDGAGLFSGLGTRVELVGSGSGDQTQRLIVGNSGAAGLTVAAGAVLDTSGQYANCLLQFHYCDSFVGTLAGDTAGLTVTGASSLVRIGSQLFVGHPGYSPSAGVAGGTVNASVQVLAGAELRTDRAQIGTRQWEATNTGAERSKASVLVSGAGSRWVSVGGPTWDAATGAVYEPGSGILTANDPLAEARIDVLDGGQIRIEGRPGVYNYLALTRGGGRSEMTISGAGSNVEFIGDAGSFEVGQRGGGSASLLMSSSGEVRGVWYISVGRDGTAGEMTLTGAGTRILANGMGSAAANGSQTNTLLDIGRSSSGVVKVLDGARIELSATGAAQNGPQLSLGRGAGSSGTLEISGAGSVVSLSAASVLAGGGLSEAVNPLVRVGRDGMGSLTISAGGKLLVDGQAVSTEEHTRSTSVFIGGTSGTLPGGQGLARVSGAGSELAVGGSDAYIGIAHGPQTTGHMTIEQQALVSSTSMTVGRAGGVGLLRLDEARLNLAGQQTGANLSGANLSIGNAGGSGTVTMDRGSVVTIMNLGSSGASLNIGGSRFYPLGTGSLLLSGGSQIDLIAAPGQAAVSIGREGSAFASLSGASRIEAGDGNVYVGRLEGSSGTLLLSEGSSLSAGWVGIGRNRLAGGGDVDGGAATLMLDDSTLTAAHLVIGKNGFVGGDGGTIVGSVINHGVLSIGKSPGSMLIEGGYTAGVDGRVIMEIEWEGGEFKTDQLFFSAGSVLDLAALQVEFRFLGATDPNAFQASGGFDIDSFFRSLDLGGGGSSDLPHDLFATASFSAQADQYRISDFSFSADGGASFSAQPVPEPGNWAMLAAGLLTLAVRRRQR